MSFATRRFRSASQLLAGVALLLATGSVGHAATEMFSATYPGPTGTGFTLTDWTTSLTVTKFDPALGVLQSIDFVLTGRVQGSAAFESRDAKANVITTNLSASITLDRPDNSQLAVVVPLVSMMTSATAYDGVLDFGGTSGATFNGLQSSLVDTVAGDKAASDLALFTGSSGAPGSISLSAAATGQSSASGSGNLVSQFTTNAGADFTVTYNYTPAPEPGTYALMLGGFGALVGVQRLRRRRR